MSIYEQNQVLHENSSWRYWKKSQKAYIDVTGKLLNKTIRIYTDKYNAYSGKHNFLCNAGYSRMGKNSLTLTFQNTGVYSYDDLKVVCQPVTKVDEQVKKLGEESLQDVKVEEHELTGKISVSKPKALVIALPYSTGFTAYVDGKNRFSYTRMTSLSDCVFINFGNHINAPYFLLLPEVLPSLCSTYSPL